MREEDLAFGPASGPAARERIAALRSCLPLRDESPESPDAARRLAAICEELGDRLEAAGELPEAVQAWQEAADHFASTDEEGRFTECSAKVLRGIKRLWDRPEQRLMLLVARIDRERIGLENRVGTEGEQGELLFRSATILQRRDRFEAARDRYERALQAFRRAPDSEQRQAECLERLAGLYHHELADASRARAYYQAAILLYKAYEPAVDGVQMRRETCEMLLEGLRT